MLRIRRATVDDLATLRPVWESMRLPVTDLEKRLTEFQVVETADDKVVGGIAFQIGDRQGRIHSEAFSDFAHADAARALFWERILTLAMNHGIFRLWTQETTPYWTRNGFQNANEEALKKLPPAWTNEMPAWLTLQLKDESAIVSVEKELALFMESEKQNTRIALDRARTFKTVMMIIFSIIAMVLLAGAAYLVFKNPQILQPRR